MDSADAIVVIGAGSTGSSTAFHLAKSGKKVILVDSGQVASGMTGKSTALVRTHYSNEIVARMALYSLRMLRDEVDSHFVNSGMVILASENEKAGIESNLEMLKRIGVDTYSLDVSKAKSQFPELNFEKREYVAYEPESGYADSVSTATSYATKAKELGAELMLGRTVKSLQVEGDSISGIEFADGSELACSKVMLCTNIWTNKLLARSGFSDNDLLPIWAAAHPVVVLRRPQRYEGKRVVVADLPSKTYFKPEGKSLLYMGSLDAELDRQSTDPDNPPSEIPFEFTSSFSEIIADRVPLMKEGTLHSTYVGMYDMSADQHPIIDELSVKGLYCCVGLSGHGFKLCPALGLINAEMLLGMESTQFDRSVFALSRFKSGRLLGSKYALGTMA